MSLSTLKLLPCLPVVDSDGCIDDDDTTSDLPKRGISRPIAHSYSKSLSGVRKSLVNVVKQLKECTDLKEDFLEAFEEWVLFRKKTIEYLNEIIKELDSIHFNTNVAKATASAGGIVCGCIGIASATQMWNGQDGSIMQLTADTGNLISAVVSNGAAGTELVLSKTRMDKARRILRKDNEQFEPIQEWFERSHDLKSAIEVISNCNIISDVFQKLMVVVPVVISAYGSLSLQVEETVKQVTKMLQKNLTRSEIEKIIFLCASVCRNPELLKIIENVHQMIRNEPSIMPVVTALVKVPCELKFILQRIHGSSTTSNPSREKSKMEAITYGFFQGVNVAIELFSVGLILEDFQKGSRSEHSSVLKEIKEQLELELTRVSRVHQRLLQNE